MTFNSNNFTKEDAHKERTPLIFCLFLSIIILMIHILYEFTAFENPIARKLMKVIIDTGLFSTPFNAHLLAFVLMTLYVMGFRVTKSDKMTLKKSLPYIFFGTLFYFGTILILLFKYLLERVILHIMPPSIWDMGGQNLKLYLLGGIYTLILFLGYVMLFKGMIRFKRIIEENLFKDKFNKKNQNFQQEKRKVINPHSVNIRTQDGWINIINPFRGTMVLGTPGSGKTYAIVEEFMKQHIQKGFSMMVYDFKYPSLSNVAYNYFLKYRNSYSVPPKIYIINFNDPMNSHRVNPIAPYLIKNISDALATAEALFYNISKEFIKKKDFFNLSGVNLVAAIIWFLRTHENGKHCTIPHVIALLDREDKQLLEVLNTNASLKSLMAPFQDSYKKKAFKQLAGQTASARIPISRLSTLETFWILNGNSLNLNINDPKHPALLFLANSPQTQKSYAPIYGLIASTLVRVTNQQNRLPLSLIVDELPTIFIDGLDNLISTGRSNLISVLISFQDLAQLTRDYGKEVAEAIFNTIGTKISGAVVAETAKKLAEMVGKVVQKRTSINYSSNGSSVGHSMAMDYLIPQEKFTQLSSGSFGGIVSDTFEQPLEQKIFLSKVLADKSDLSKQPIPPLMEMDEVKFKKAMETNYLKVKREIDIIVNQFVSKPAGEPEEGTNNSSPTSEGGASASDVTEREMER